MPQPPRKSTSVVCRPSSRRKTARSLHHNTACRICCSLHPCSRCTEGSNSVLSVTCKLAGWSSPRMVQAPHSSACTTAVHIRRWAHPNLRPCSCRTACSIPLLPVRYILGLWARLRIQKTESSFGRTTAVHIRRWGHPNLHPCSRCTEGSNSVLSVTCKLAGWSSPRMVQAPHSSACTTAVHIRRWAHPNLRPCSCRTACSIPLLPVRYILGLWARLRIQKTESSFGRTTAVHIPISCGILGRAHWTRSLGQFGTSCLPPSPADGRPPTRHPSPADCRPPTRHPGKTHVQVCASQTCIRPGTSCEAPGDCRRGCHGCRSTPAENGCRMTGEYGCRSTPGENGCRMTSDDSCRMTGENGCCAGVRSNRKNCHWRPHTYPNGQGRLDNEASSGSLESCRK